MTKTLNDLIRMTHELKLSPESFDDSIATARKAEYIQTLCSAVKDFESSERERIKNWHRRNRYEKALGLLWEMVEDRLTDEEKVWLEGKCDVFDQLQCFGPGGPCGIVHLEISSWVGTSAIGASHFYGRLRWEDESYHNMELVQRISREMARSLNFKDGGKTWRAGMKSERFDTREDLIQCAVASYKTICPSAKLLVLENHRGVPYVILDGPEELKAKVGKLIEMADEIGWFDVPSNTEKMLKICREYEGLVKDFTN